MLALSATTLSLSLSFSLSPSLSLPTSLPLSFSLSLSLPLSVVVCVCACVCTRARRERLTGDEMMRSEGQIVRDTRSLSACLCLCAVVCVSICISLSLTHSLCPSLSLSLPPSLSLCLYMPRAESLWQVRKGGREGGRERHLQGKPFKPLESLSKRNAWVSHFAARLSLLLRLYAGIQREREAETVSERT